MATFKFFSNFRTTFGCIVKQLLLDLLAQSIHAYLDLPEFWPNHSPTVRGLSAESNISSIMSLAYWRRSFSEDFFLVPWSATRCIFSQSRPFSPKGTPLANWSIPRLRSSPGTHKNNDGHTQNRLWPITREGWYWKSIVKGPSIGESLFKKIFSLGDISKLTFQWFWTLTKHAITVLVKTSFSL